MIKKFKYMINRNVIFCFLILYLIAFFGPSILSSGLYYDDIYNFHTYGYNYFGLNVLERTLSIVKQWIATGRFFPFAFYMYALFAVIKSVIIYKIFILISVIINCILTSILIEKITKSRKIGILTILFFPLFIPLSATYFSAIYGLHMLVQSVVLLCTISLILFYNYVATSKKRFLFGSLILVIISLFMYEISYTFFIGYVVIVFLGESNIYRRIKKLAPIIAAFGFGATTYLYFRVTSTNYYSGIKINIEPTIIIKTFFKQLSGSLPQVRYKTEASVFGLNKFTDMFSCNIIFYCIVCLMFIALLYMCLRLKDNNEINCKRLSMAGILYGMVLCILPAALISTSSKYQNELEWGKGYQVFYISSIGLAIIMAILMNAFLNKAKLNMKVVVCILIILISGNNIIQNSCLGEKTIAVYNGYTNARGIVKNAIEHGILDDIEANDVLVANSTAAFDGLESAAFYSYLAKKRVQACSTNDFAALIYGTNNTVGYTTFDYTGNTYVINHQVTEEKGVVVLAKLNYYENGLYYCSGNAKVYTEEYTDNTKNIDNVKFNDNYTLDQIFIELSN